MPSTSPEITVVSTVDEESGLAPTPPIERKVLTKGEIFAADDIVIEWVEVPEWGGGVYVRGLTGSQRDRFERAMVETRGKSRTLNVINFRAKLIAASVVDTEDRAKAKLVFTDQDIEPLAKKSSSALQRVYDKASRLSGFSAEEVDTLTVELGNDQSDGSGSA